LIEASQRRVSLNSQGRRLRGGLNPVAKIKSELEIKILENVPRNIDKLRRLLKVK
jgi:hypothetical protein